MLIDELLPKYDVSDRYHIDIEASPKDVWQALWTADMCDSPVVSVLFSLRGLPSDHLSLSDLDDLKFKLIAEDMHKEVVFGLIGQFWTLDGHLQDFEPSDFAGFDAKGYAKCAWSFQLDPDGGRTRLTTETRVKCLDDDSRFYFDWYWAFVRPFSGWTRKEILSTVKKAAEGGAEAASAGGRKGGSA